jgi:hypothetical protein
MAALSDFLELELLDHILRNETWTPPTSVWIALFTADNGLETNVQTSEVSGGSYARLEVGGSSGRSFTVAAAGATTSNEDWIFPTATADWGTITHCAVMSASSAGQVLIHGSLTAQKTVNNGDTFKFSVGDFDVTMA